MACAKLLIYLATGFEQSFRRDEWVDQAITGAQAQLAEAHLVAGYALQSTQDERSQILAKLERVEQQLEQVWVRRRRGESVGSLMSNRYSPTGQ